MGKRKARFKQPQSTLPNHVVNSYPAFRPKTGRQEHYSMAVEDFSVCTDDDGVEYVTFKENHPRKGKVV